MLVRSRPGRWNASQVCHRNLCYTRHAQIGVVLTDSTTTVARTSVSSLPELGHQRRVPLALWAWAVVLVPSMVVAAGAWSHRWVTDDAFIDFRVVGNILAGHGPVYNVGERVEVYTSPLWVAILTAFRGLVPVLSVEWWAVVLG